MPKIKHTILQWTRETAKLSIVEAAQKLNIKDGTNSSAIEKLQAYENGEKEPSRSLLLRMSNQYHQPLLTFYLDNPPTIGDRGEDFRTLPPHFEALENANVDVLIRNIKARQCTVRETLIDEDEEDRLAFIGKHTKGSGVKRIVRTIQDILKMSLSDYRDQSSYKNAFKYLRQKVELAGVFVLLKGNLGSHHSNIDVTAFRGFALSDDIAPFIVINDRDAESAWPFTLMHEMVHLILGQTGISGTSDKKQIERFCNAVASEYLLPASQFTHFQLSCNDFGKVLTEISDYAYSQKLSNSHIAYRLYLRGDIDKSKWKKLCNYFRKKWLENRKAIKEKNRQKEGGPSYYLVQQYKLGALVELVQRLTYSGALTTTKAGMLLEVKPLKVHKLFEFGQLA